MPTLTPSPPVKTAYVPELKVKVQLNHLEPWAENLFKKYLANYAFFEGKRKFLVHFGNEYTFTAPKLAVMQRPGNIVPRVLAGGETMIQNAMSHDLWHMNA
jgi:hypothetical protein